MVWKQHWIIRHEWPHDSGDSTKRADASSSSHTTHNAQMTNTRLLRPEKLHATHLMSTRSTTVRLKDGASTKDFGEQKGPIADTSLDVSGNAVATVAVVEPTRSDHNPFDCPYEMISVEDHELAAGRIEHNQRASINGRQTHRYPEGMRELRFARLLGPIRSADHRLRDAHSSKRLVKQCRCGKSPRKRRPSRWCPIFTADGGGGLVDRPIDRERLQTISQVRHYANESCHL